MQLTNKSFSIFINKFTLIKADEVLVLKKLKEYLMDMQSIDYVMLMDVIEFVLYDLDAYNNADFMTIYKSIVIE